MLIIVLLIFAILSTFKSKLLYALWAISRVTAELFVPFSKIDIKYTSFKSYCIVSPAKIMLHNWVNILTMLLSTYFSSSSIIPSGPCDLPFFLSLSAFSTCGLVIWNLTFLVFKLIWIFKVTLVLEFLTIWSSSQYDHQ